MVNTPHDKTADNFTVRGVVFEAPKLSDGLHIVATPIGNLNDASLRMLDTLAAADIILCEDTRVTAKLLNRYEIKSTLKPYHDHNAAKIRPEIIKQLSEGSKIALVSDAGMPLVSDPGFKLVQDCIGSKIELHVIPGPSAPITALALSGIASDHFSFIGFLPQKKMQREQVLKSLKDNPGAVIFFESTKRITKSLQSILDFLGDRQIVLAREMTKLHEEFLRGSVMDVISELNKRESLKGELTVIIAPNKTEAKQRSKEELVERIKDVLGEKSVSETAAQLSKEFGLSRKQIYQLALDIKDER